MKLRPHVAEPSAEEIAEALSLLRREFRQRGPMPRTRLRRILWERGLIDACAPRGLRKTFTLSDAGRLFLAAHASSKRPPILATTTVELIEGVILDELCAAFDSYVLSVGAGTIGSTRPVTIDWRTLALRIAKALQPGKAP